MQFHFERIRKFKPKYKIVIPQKILVRNTLLIEILNRKFNFPNFHM